MKTALKTMLTAAKRADHVLRHGIAWCQMRSLEATLQGMLDALPTITDETTLASLRATVSQLEDDLAAARSHYSSFLPAGRRIVWETA